MNYNQECLSPNALHKQQHRFIKDLVKVAGLTKTYGFEETKGFENAEVIKEGDQLTLFLITSRVFRTFFLRLARSSSPLPEIRPSWEAFAHPRSGCLLWFLVTKNSVHS